MCSVSCTLVCTQRHLETIVDIYFELQVFIDKFRQNRLGAGDADLLWVTVYMERLAFFAAS